MWHDSAGGQGPAPSRDIARLSEADASWSPDRGENVFTIAEVVGESATATATWFETRPAAVPHHEGRFTVRGDVAPTVDVGTSGALCRRAAVRAGRLFTRPG